MILENSAPPRNWWQRNWKWVVPAGCLTLLALFALFVAGVAGIAFTAIKSSDVCRDSLARAKGDPQVREALGEPVKDGWYVTGQLNTSGPVGDANLAIPLRGPRGKGTLYVEAHKTAGRWEYETLEVEVDGQEERINLLEE